MGTKYLIHLRRGETAVVKELLGGEAARHRLETLGVRSGKSITMISTHFWRGPVTIMINKTKIAIGYGMAEKIIVEVC